MYLNGWSTGSEIEKSTFPPLLILILAQVPRSEDPRLVQTNGHLGDQFLGVEPAIGASRASEDDGITLVDRDLVGIDSQWKAVGKITKHLGHRP